MPTIVGSALGIVIFAIILSAITWPVQEVETSFTSEPYTYEQSLVRENQIRKLCCPWFSIVTQAQYLITNTDTNSGTFALNFVFDNGAETETRTETTAILAGEEIAVTVDSPLRGKSEVSLNVIPPSKSLPKERTVTKRVNGWDYLGRFVFRFR